MWVASFHYTIKTPPIKRAESGHPTYSSYLMCIHYENGMEVHMFLAERFMKSLVLSQNLCNYAELFFEEFNIRLGFERKIGWTDSQQISLCGRCYGSQQWINWYTLLAANEHAFSIPFNPLHNAPNAVLITLLYWRRLLYVCSSLQGCPTIALSHQSPTRASKRATNQKLKALFNWEVFVKHDQLSLSDVSFELFLVQIVFKKTVNSISIDWSWS